MLASPEHRYVIPKIKAAISAGIKPTSMIFHTQPTDAWERFDFLLLEAYQSLRDETCPKCGHPVWLCRSQSANVYFDVRDDFCQAERALKEAEARTNKTKLSPKERKDLGRFQYTVPMAPEGTELPAREEYYADLAAANGTVK